MFYFPFIFFDLFFARVSAERRKASVSSTRLSCCLSDGGLQPAQRATFPALRCDEVFLTHDRFYNAVRSFLQHVSELRLDVFG